jgi:hypothetical protein
MGFFIIFVETFKEYIMGQRHQIFIKVNNPLKLKRVYADDTDKKLARKMFGSGKHTILAIHHQWL